MLLNDIMNPELIYIIKVALLIIWTCVLIISLSLTGKI